MFKSLITRCASTTHELHSPENLVRSSPLLPTGVLSLVPWPWEREVKSKTFKVKISIFSVSPVTLSRNSATHFSSVTCYPTCKADYLFHLSGSVVVAEIVARCLRALQREGARAQRVGSWNIKESYTKLLFETMLTLKINANMLLKWVLSSFIEHCNLLATLQKDKDC